METITKKPLKRDKPSYKDLKKAKKDHRTLMKDDPADHEHERNVIIAAMANHSVPKWGGIAFQKLK
jgi:hypothetical protein